MNDANIDGKVDVPAGRNQLRTGLPVLPPLAAVIEVLLLVVLPGVLDYAVPSFPNLNEMQPHFFWFPVLLLTLQYGSASGLLAAAAAILLSSFLGWPEQEIGENHFTYLLRIWLQPMLWIATAVILGQIRLRQIERKEALGREVVLLSNQRQAIAEHARNLRERCDTLERVITTRWEAKPHLLLAALGEMQDSDPMLRREACERGLQLAFGGATAAIYEVDGAGGLACVARLPEVAGKPLPSPVGADSPLVQALLGEQRGLSVLHAGDEVVLAGRGVAAVPVWSGRAAVAGALVLETAPAEMLSDATCKQLAVFAAMLGIRGELGAAGGRVPRAAPAAIERRPGSARHTWRRARREAILHAASGHTKVR